MFPRARDGQSWTREDYANWRRRYFARAREAAGLAKSFTPYHCRYTAASFLVAQGWVVTEVARELGHSPQMCLRTYAHVFEDPPTGDPSEWVREARRAA